MKTLLVSLLLMAMLGSSTPARPAQASALSSKQSRASQRRISRERRPKMRAAINALQAARLELEHASTDFGGYKRDAIESVDKAMKRLRLALQFDSK